MNFTICVVAISVAHTFHVFILSGLSDGWKSEVPEDIQKRVDDMISQELKDTDLYFE